MMKRVLLLLTLLLALVATACRQQLTPATSPTEAAPAEAVAPTEAAPTAEAAPAQQMTDPMLTGKVWQWVSLTTPVEEITVADPTRYTITFNEDGTANIQADCNSVGATYTADGSAITITLGFSTLVACPPDSQDQLFKQSLSAAALYFFQDGDLFIDMMADSGTMRFTAASTEGMTPAPSSLVGPTWQWTSSTGPSGDVSVADPSRYTITFNESGAAGIKADCNVGNATYTADEAGTLNITLGVTTLAFCGEDSQDQLFRQSLSAAASYYIENGDLFINLADNGGTMRFVAGVAAGPETELPSLAGPVWQWVSLTGPASELFIGEPDRYTITFNEDGTAAIKADCNQVVATYTTEGSNISITPGPTTLAACPPDSQDQMFTQSLAAAATYFFENGDLLIDMTADSGTLRFVAAEEASLTGVTWQWAGLTTPVEETIIADPSRYTILFNEDGTANIKADCNSVGATYTTDGSSISITLGPTTLVACPPDSQDQLFTQSLAAAAVYFFQDGDLFIDQFADAGTMRFIAGESETATPSEQASLIGPTWEWLSVTGAEGEIMVSDPTRYTIVFNEDGTAGIQADCNVGNAAYTTDGSALSITLGVSTLAFCGEESQDELFRQSLSAASSYFIDGDILFIDVAGGFGPMRFRPAGQADTEESTPPAAAGLVGPTWQMTALVQGENRLPVADPTRYTITFNADGSANIKADCNNVIASYTADATGALSITLGPSTLAFCGESSQDQLFLGGLSNAEAYMIDSGLLSIQLKFENGFLEFAPATG